MLLQGGDSSISAGSGERLSIVSDCRETSLFLNAGGMTDVLPTNVQWILAFRNGRLLAKSNGSAMNTEPAAGASLAP